MPLVASKQTNLLILKALDYDETGRESVEGRKREAECDRGK